MYLTSIEDLYLAVLVVGAWIILIIYSDHLFPTNSIKLCQIVGCRSSLILERIFQPLSYYVPCTLFLCNASPYTQLHLHRLVHTANWIGYSSA